MAQFETWLTRDLSRPNYVQALDHALFAGDSKGNVIGVIVLKDGAPYNIELGSVDGYVMKGDGTTETISYPYSGTHQGNRAWIELTENALNVPGKVQISIRLTQNGEKTVLASCTAMVVRTDTADDISETIDYSGINSGDSQDIEVIEFIDDP